MKSPLVDFFQKINSTNSVKDKEEILRQYKDDDYILELLSRCLDPYKLFYIKTMPKYELANVQRQNSRYTYLAFIKLTDQLKNREITGNDAKAAVVDFFAKTDPVEAEIYEKILLKKAIGIGTSTVNKVIPKFIPEFSVMLAPSQLPQLTNLKYPLYVQPKYDGFRAVFKEGSFYTRTGLVYPNANLKAYFSALEGLQDVVLDGELYVHGQPFQDLAKVLNADNAPIPKGLKYHVYDCIPLTEWNLQKGTKTYEDRLKLIRSIVNDTIGDYSKVIDAPTDKVYDAAQVVEIYKKALKNGFEGCMLKSPEGKYQWKRVTLRSQEMVKLKPFETLDLKVTGIYAGEDKYEGMAGGLIVDYNGIPVCVGSGFDDLSRKTIFDNQNDYIGKTAEIKYFEETEDKSLRFPIFIRWRDDK